MQTDNYQAWNFKYISRPTNDTDIMIITIVLWAYNCQKWKKVDSFHVPAIRFIG